MGLEVLPTVVLPNFEAVTAVVALTALVAFSAFATLSIVIVVGVPAFVTTISSSFVPATTSVTKFV